MKAFLAAVLFLALLTSTAFAGLSTRFLGDLHAGMCDCDTAVIPVLVRNTGPDDATILFSAGDSSHLQVISPHRAFTLSPGEGVVKQLFVKSGCGAASTAVVYARADGVEGQESSVAGIVDIRQCNLLSLSLKLSALGCDGSDYQFTLSNNGKYLEKGIFSTDLNGLSATISQTEFLLKPGESTDVLVRVKNIPPGDKGKIFSLTAKSESGAKASASAGLASNCPAPQPASQQASGEGTVTQQQSGPFGFTGFFTAFNFVGLWRALVDFLRSAWHKLVDFVNGIVKWLHLEQPARQAEDAARQVRLDWLLVAIAVLLVIFFYLAVRGLESRESQMDKQVLGR